MRKILIISTNAIGDTYLSMSAIPLLKKNLNDVVIDFVIEKHSVFLFEYEEIRKLIIVKRNITHLLSNVFQIRKERYDYVFSFFPGVINTLFLLTANAKNKGGYPNFIRKKEWANSDQVGFVLINKKIKKIKWKSSENYLNRIGLIFNQFGFKFENLTKYRFGNKFNNEKYKEAVVLHPFSRYLDRSFSLEQVKALVNYFFSGVNSEIIIIGDDKILEIKKLIKNDLMLVIRPSVDELINIVHCKLFISVDSFPLHVADAYNTNFVGFFSSGTYPEAVLINKYKAIKFKRSSMSEIPLDDLINKFNKFLMKNAL